MVSQMEKSGRERLGGVLPAIEISAVAATREGALAERRGAARRRARREFCRGTECVFAFERADADRLRVQSIRGGLHRAWQAVHAGETPSAHRSRLGEFAAVSLPRG